MLHKMTLIIIDINQIGKTNSLPYCKNYLFLYKQLLMFNYYFYKCRNYIKESGYIFAHSANSMSIKSNTKY